MVYAEYIKHQTKEPGWQLEVVVLMLPLSWKEHFYLWQFGRTLAY
jgi:hypothetical protein